MIDLAGLAPGMRVLDLATGRGEPALPAALRVCGTGVGATGTVLGIDVDPAMLALARARADREGIANLELSVASAESLEWLPAASFDAALCRWGLMYMRDPVRALVQTRRVLRPGAAMVLALWTEPSKASWAALPRRVLSRHIDLAKVEADAVGAFRYAALGALERDLAAAGFLVEATEEMFTPVMEAQTGGEIAAWCKDLGFLRPAGAMASGVLRAIETEIAEAAEDLREGPVLRLGGITRLVVARST
jgi:ubiquinone/menaquinone biosynthesis C-methylase UbiE